MPPLASSASKSDAGHDDAFVDTDAYLHEMAQRIQKLRSLVPNLALAHEAKPNAGNKTGKAPRRRLKSGTSL
ncbi:MAG: hypothetical protein AAFU56_02630 [Pseudomonadota bacterium]